MDNGIHVSEKESKGNGPIWSEKTFNGILVREHPRAAQANIPINGTALDPAEGVPIILVVNPLGRQNAVPEHVRIAGFIVKSICLPHDAGPNAQPVPPSIVAVGPVLHHVVVADGLLVPTEKLAPHLKPIGQIVTNMDSQFVELKRVLRGVGSEKIVVVAEQAALGNEAVNVHLVRRTAVSGGKVSPINTPSSYSLVNRSNLLWVFWLWMAAGPFSD